MELPKAYVAVETVRRHGCTATARKAATRLVCGREANHSRSAKLKDWCGCAIVEKSRACDFEDSRRDIAGGFRNNGGEAADTPDRFRR